MDGENGSAMRETFEKAYIAHKDRLLTLATAFTGDRSLAEDIVHDTFASLMKSAWRLRNGSNIAAYLAVCVRNRAIDIFRKNKRHAQHGGDAAAHRSDNASADPSKLAARDEEAEMLLGMVSELPDTLREVLSLRIWAELSFQEIAGLQQTTKSTAHARYGQALEKLRLKIDGGS